MDLRGEVHYYNEIPLIITYHPAALLRNQVGKELHGKMCKCYETYMMKLLKIKIVKR